jgi:hypothetical protein
MKSSLEIPLYTANYRRVSSRFRGVDAALLSVTPHDWGPHRGAGTGYIGEGGGVGGRDGGRWREVGGGRKGRGGGEGQEREGEGRTGYEVAHTPSLRLSPPSRTGLYTSRGRKTESRHTRVTSHLPVMGLDFMLCERALPARTFGSSTSSCFSLRSILGTLDHRFCTQHSIPHNRFKITTSDTSQRGVSRESAAALLKSAPTATHYLVNSKHRNDSTAEGSKVTSRLFRLILPDSNGSNSRTSAVHSLTASLLSLSSAVTGERK